MEDCWETDATPLCTGEAGGGGGVVRVLQQQDCKEDCWRTDATPMCTGEAGGRGGWSECVNNRIVRKTAGGQTLHACVQVRQGGGQSATTTGLQGRLLGDRCYALVYR